MRHTEVRPMCTGHRKKPGFRAWQISGPYSLSSHLALETSSLHFVYGYDDFLENNISLFLFPVTWNSHNSVGHMVSTYQSVLDWYFKISYSEHTLLWMRVTRNTSWRSLCPQHTHRSSWAWRYRLSYLKMPKMIMNNLVVKFMQRKTPDSL